jgi:hypothetical protein
MCWPGSGGVCGRSGHCPKLLVWDRQAGIHGHGGRPSEEFAAFCGQLRVDWHFCEPADPQAKGIVERLQDFLERSFEPGRGFCPMKCVWSWVTDSAVVAGKDIHDHQCKCAV